MTSQRMLLVIYSEFLETVVRDCLARERITAFSELPLVLGRGEAGAAEDTRIWPSHNCAVLTVLPGAEAGRLVQAFRDVVAEQQQRRTTPVPLRAFVLPCEQVI